MENYNNKTEFWKEIPYSNGFYQSSNLGNVKSLKWGKERILKPVLNKNGYFYVNIVLENKIRHVQVHKLIAITFLNHVTYKNKLVVDHIDNIKTNNKLNNLQLISQRLNNSKNRINKYSEFTGVKIVGKNKWKSSITINNKYIHLGNFDTEMEANLYYKKAIYLLENNLEIEIKKPNYASKFNGVSFNKKNCRWVSRITVNNKRLYLGSFKTENEAINKINLFNNQI